jgi:WD40 repeat protein/tetratricopeptide (TPR) repeat protein
MADFYEPEEVAAYNEDSLKILIRAITRSQGEFSLILVRCNYVALQEQIVQQLRECCPVKIQELVLEQSVKTLYTTIEAELRQEQPSALMVFGLESVYALAQVLTATNQVREEFRKFSFPLVLWVTDAVLKKLIRLVPDFESWATTIDFAIATDELIRFIQKTTDQVFAKVLEIGAGRFLDNSALHLGVGSPGRAELESAQQELLQRSVTLDPELEASLEFVLGRDANGSIDRSLQHLERSLALWQQQPSSQELEANKQENSQALLNLKSTTCPADISAAGRSPVGGRQNLKSVERVGCVFYSLGLWWYTYGERHPAEQQHARCQTKDYFQQCVKVFDQHQRSDLVAKFINAFAVSLQRLQQWDELEVVAKKALALHKLDADRFRIARAYGFLAEVHVAKSAWTEAEKFAQQALSVLASAWPAAMNISSEERINLDWERFAHQGWYLFALARAQKALGRYTEAIKTLETARVETKPEYEPELYIQILEKLRECYFKQGQYLIAFQVKQKQRSIEQQFGFRAFVGADQLLPKQQVTNPVLPHVKPSETGIQGIGALVRQQDIIHLIDRISRDDHKLTVIHGQSGVGKSSILQAGLIPALKHKIIGARDVIPILLRVYTDWIHSCGRGLSEALKENRRISLSFTLDSTAAILEQLRTNTERNLLTVLIFDQFEEFFFVCKELTQRRLFYDFLRECLETPYVKVILSLREDYLHYLLEWNRLTDLEIINNNILDKHILYYLGNFKPDYAKSVIESLTEPTPFSLERSLIDQLVQDLSIELDQVRPIELQVVGAQLQAENITTLEAYRQRGPKEELVKRYLEATVQDCGAENQQIANLVLYLLTDDQETRPLKTRAELAEDLELEADQLEKLDLVLEVLVGEGLVFELPEAPAHRYQLVHDYLVPFIRQGQEPELLTELKLTREQLKQTLYQEQQERKRAEIAEIEALISLSQALLLSHDQLGALVACVKGGRKLLAIEAPPELKHRTGARLRETLCNMQERNRLEGHEAAVFDVSFSPDGQTIASVDENGTIKLWQRDGRQLASCWGHQESVFSISFSPNSQMFASASADKTVKLWRRDGTLLKTFEGHHSMVFCVSFSPDGKAIASASGDGAIKLWSIDGTWQKTINRSGACIFGVSFSPDGQWLATASQDGTIKIWSLDGTLLRTFEGHKDSVFRVKFSPDGQKLASASADGTVKLWSCEGKELKTLQMHNFMVFRISFSPDGQMLALSCADKTVRLCGLDGSKIQTFRGHNGKVFGVSFSPGGHMLASSSEDKTVRLWSLDGIGQHTAQGHNGRILDISLSPDGTMFASASEDNTLKLWRLDGTLLKTFQGSNAAFRSVSFSPDGQLLASASVDATVKLWHLNGTLLKTLPGHNASVRSVRFSPDGQLLASASNDLTVKLWRLDGTLLKTLKGHSASILSVSFSPDGQLLASASEDETIKLWNLDGTLLKTLQGHRLRIISVSFSPDSQLLASTSADRTVKLWNREGSLVTTLEGHEASVREVSFSPDGQTIASVSADRTVKLWSREGNLIRTLKGHLAGICHVSFSSNGQIVISMDEYSTVKLWSLDGIELRTFKLPVNTSRLLCDFSPAHTMATSTSTSTTLDLESLLKQGCNWLDDYLQTNVNLRESDSLRDSGDSRSLCEGIGTSVAGLRASL